MLRLYRRCISKTKESMIRGWIIKVVIIKVVAAHSSEVVALWVGTLYINYIRINVNLVDQIRPYIRLPIEANLFSVIVLTLEVVHL